MFNSWFSDNAGSSSAKNDNLSGGEKSSSTFENRQRSASLPVDAQVSPSRNVFEKRKSSAAIITNPHDSVVDEMNERLWDLQRAGTSPGVSGLPANDDRQGSSSRLNQPKTRSRLPENMYDPFTGQSIANYTPGEFTESEDDLWTHLAHIRDLQSEIAMMHSHMEGLGASGHSHVAEQPADEEGVTVDEDAKAAKAAEFAKLPDRFNGRKDAIDAIMAKLETLSHAINDFHSAREPVIHSQSRCSILSEQRESYLKKAGTMISEAKNEAAETVQIAHVASGIRTLQDNSPLKRTPESIERSLDSA